MQYNSEIIDIIYHHITGVITPPERDILNRWLEADASHRSFFESVTDTDIMRDEIMSRSIVDYKRPAADMQRLIDTRRRAKTVRFVLRVAAVIAVLLSATAVWHYFYTGDYTMRSDNSDTPLIAEVEEPLTFDDIVAGTTKAIITDSDGHAIALTSGESGLEASAHFVEPTESDTPRELCLDVPRGGEFKVILEDSTEVWLNSQSTIRYPEVFGEHERRVAITGEAYFKVRKDPSRPFYVDTDRQQIRVYGTTFNIRAYSDEDATFTTLESGSVSLRRSSAPSGEIYLSVGHQAVLDHHADQVQMSTVDPEIVTSWRHGRFVFDNQPLDRIMRDLSRWYDFEYEFADESLAGRVFMGSTRRYSDFRTAIQILENCGGIRFTITPENKILISSVK